MNEVSDKRKNRSWGKIGAIGCVGVIAFAVLMGICTTLVTENKPGDTAIDVEEKADEETSSNEVPERAASWIQVASWSGSGNKKTETFHVESREWKIRWETTNENIAGFLGVTVNNDDGSVEEYGAVSQSGIGADETILRTGAGDYYLDITAANIDWSITVEDKR